MNVYLSLEVWSAIYMHYLYDQVQAAQQTRPSKDSQPEEDIAHESAASHQAGTA